MKIFAFAAAALALFASAGAARAQSRDDLAPLPPHTTSPAPAPATSTAPPPATAPATAPPPPPAMTLPAQEPIRVILPNPLVVQLAPTIGTMPTTVAMSGPRVVDDWDGHTVPEGYHEETRVRRKLVIGGFVTFASLYVLSAGAAASMNDEHDGSGNLLFLPALGPFLQMSQPNSNDSTAQFFLIVDGVAQTAGLVMAFAGLASPQKVLVRNDLGKVHVAPRAFAARHGGAFGLTGTF